MAVTSKYQRQLNPSELQQRAINVTRQIAQEGRKFGVGLILISQRPSRLDETTLAMCNSYIIMRICQEFKNQKLHVFGIGGTATLHIAALLGIHSVDSSGWRNRAARGLIQLPGTGERVIADLGNWRGRRLSEDEFNQLKNCPCPACRLYGVEGLKASGVVGFSNRATHNLWVLLEEARLIEEHLLAGTYKDWYKEHLDNTMYRPLIDRLVETSL